MYLTTYDTESLAGLGLTEDEYPSLAVYKILHDELGYSDEVIRGMSRRLLDDIVGDYSVGIRRYAGQTLSPTDPTKVIGTRIVLQEPAAAARAAFNQGVMLDLSSPSRIAQRLRELPTSLEIAFDEALDKLGLPDLGKFKKYLKYTAVGVGGLAVYKVLRTLRLL
jgi:hypothetical protein